MIVGWTKGGTREVSECDSSQRGYGIQRNMYIYQTRSKIEYMKCVSRQLSKFFVFFMLLLLLLIGCVHRKFSNYELEADI